MPLFITDIKLPLTAPEQQAVRPGFGSLPPSQRAGEICPGI